MRAVGGLRNLANLIAGARIEKPHADVMRVALGASRLRLIARALVESVLLR